MTKKTGRQLAASDRELVYRAGGTSPARASRLTWIYMATIATALRKRNVGECFLIRHIVCIYPISDSVVWRDIERWVKYAGDRTGGNICHIVRDAAPVRKSRIIACDYTETPSRCNRRGAHTGIQTKQVGDGAGRRP